LSVFLQLPGKPPDGRYHWRAAATSYQQILWTNLCRSLAGTAENRMISSLPSPAEIACRQKIHINQWLARISAILVD